MSEWKQKMADILNAGRAPTNDELEEALQGALVERKEMQASLDRLTLERDGAMAVVAEMTQWMGKITHAFLSRDAEGLAETVGKFVAKNVKLVPAAAEGVH